MSINEVHCMDKGSIKKEPSWALDCSIESAITENKGRAKKEDPETLNSSLKIATCDYGFVKQESNEEKHEIKEESCSDEDSMTKQDGLCEEEPSWHFDRSIQSVITYGYDFIKNDQNDEKHEIKEECYPDKNIKKEDGLCAQEPSWHLDRSIQPVINESKGCVKKKDPERFNDVPTYGYGFIRRKESNKNHEIKEERYPNKNIKKEHEQEPSWDSDWSVQSIIDNKQQSEKEDSEIFKKYLNVPTCVVHSIKEEQRDHEINRESYSKSIEVDRDFKTPGLKIEAEDYMMNPSVGDDGRNSKLRNEDIYNECNTGDEHVLSTEEVYFSCRKCGKMLEETEEARKRTEVKMRCHLCQQMFSETSGLFRHRCIRMNFECGVCKEMMCASEKITYHKRIHCISLKCSVCDKILKSTSSLKAHMYSHVKTYKCNVCDKAFVKNYALNRHILVHSRIKTFQMQHL